MAPHRSGFFADSLHGVFRAQRAGPATCSVKQLSGWLRQHESQCRYLPRGRDVGVSDTAAGLSENPEPTSVNGQYQGLKNLRLPFPTTLLSNYMVAFVAPALIVRRRSSSACGKKAIASIRREDDRGALHALKSTTRGQFEKELEGA